MFLQDFRTVSNDGFRTVSTVIDTLLHSHFKQIFLFESVNCHIEEFRFIEPVWTIN